MFLFIIGSACSIGRSHSQQFGGSSSTVNELCIAPSTSVGTPLSMTSTRRIFASETDIRESKTLHLQLQCLSSTNIASNNIQHSTSSSALRTADYHHQVTYTPQTYCISSTILFIHNKYPSPSYIPDNLSSSIVKSPTTSTTNINHNYTSSTSLNSTASGGTITTNKE